MDAPQLHSNLLAARKRDFSAKLFYSFMREARERGQDICDIGSTIEVDTAERPLLEELIRAAHEESVRRDEYTQYASSWGTLEFRTAIADFFTRWGAAGLDPKTEVMVSRGIIDSVKKVIDSLDVTHVIVPSIAPYYVEAFSLLRGKTVIVAPLDLTTGNLDLSVLRERIRRSGAKAGKMLLYITHPSAPAGTVMEDAFVEDALLPFLREEGVWLVSDSYVAATRFDGGRMRPILSFPGAKDVAVEAITVSKEIGLPSARAGGIAGNRQIIEAVRIYAATTIDMIALPSLRLATMALERIAPSISGSRIVRELQEENLPRFRAMKWPVLSPRAGIDMLVSVPPGFARPGIGDPALTASFSLLRRFGVAFFPCSVFSQDGESKFFLRLVLKQHGGKIPAALDSLKARGFVWETFTADPDDTTFLEERVRTLDLTKL